MNYRTQGFLEEAAIYALLLGVIVLLGAGLYTAVNYKNVQIEARCQEQGGQVLRTPGELSRCLLPPTR
jgi:hypothetical protein